MPLSSYLSPARDLSQMTAGSGEALMWVQMLIQANGRSNAERQSRNVSHQFGHR